jgi:RND family efflux transporter MFP subunit
MSLIAKRVSPRRPVRHFAFAIFACLGIACGAVASKPAIAEPVVPVVAETARNAQLVNRLELTGTVTSPRVSQISTSVPGLVTRIHHDSGATVRENDLLLELDPALEEIAIQQAKAEIAESEAELADTRRRLKIAESLAERSFGPQNTVDSLRSEVQTRTAVIARRRALLASAEERLSRHFVRAPYAGVISQRMAEAGQWIVPGTTVFELVDTSGLRIDVPVPQQYFPQLNSTAEITLQFEAMPDSEFPAKIGAVIPVSDPRVRTFTLRALPTRKDLPITPGMSARVGIGLQSGQEGVVVSRDAVIRYPDGRTTVWVLEANGESSMVKERRVETGLAFDGLVHVRSGLKAGERVVVRGNEALREGQAVRLAS